MNGITFCQANFKLMGEDIAALAREWCAQEKIFFVHFRDVEGTREHFRETFHDNGPVDLAQCCGLSRVRLRRTHASRPCAYAGRRIQRQARLRHGRQSSRHRLHEGRHGRARHPLLLD